MKVYTYDWSTFEYLFEETAHESESGVVIPKHSTNIAPPEPVEGKLRVFNAASKTWSYKDQYTPPPVDPVEPDPFPPLKPYQFWGVVRAYGYEQPLWDFVNAIGDPTEKGIASAMLEFSLEFRRDHPLIEQARVALNLTNEELNHLWTVGTSL